jgi:outer membrane biosynthesis protein TonB
MRSGVLISAALHAAFVASLMLSAPRAFDAAPGVVEVELVRAEDIDQPEKEEPSPEKPNVWDFPDEKPKFDLPRLSPTERNQPAPKSQAAVPKQQPAPAEATQAASQPASQAKPTQSQQAALTPPAQPAPAPPAPAPPKGEPSVFDPASIPMLLDLPNAQEKGFDFEATTVANISSEDRAAFRAHLRKCWKVPPGQPLGPSTRVVLRVYLRPNGALASEPVLIEASASRDGPVVLLAAKRALKDCQPFSFLPPDKYPEWKVLDLSFTPRDMAGG